MDICLSHISKAFQGKPVIRDFSLTIERESSRQKWENDCHKDPPSPLAMPLASILVTICLLLWMVQNAITTHKSDSLVGSNSKRMTLTPLSSSCVGSDSRRVISPSLTTPNFSVRRRMMPSHHRKKSFPWHCQRHSLRHTGTLIVLPMRKHEKSGKILEAASRLLEMLPSIVLVIGIMLFGSDIYSLFPLYSTMAILVITYVILFLPYTQSTSSPPDT